MYAPWLGYGAGVTNYLSVPDLPLDTAEGTEFEMPGGTIMNADLGSFKPITCFNDPYFRDNVAESIAHSWYDGDWQTPPVGRGHRPGLHRASTPRVATPGSRRRASRASPCRSVRWPRCWRPSPPGDETTVKWATEFLEIAGSVAGAKLDPGGPALDPRSPRGARHPRRGHRRPGARATGKLLVDNIASGDTDIFTPFEFPTGEIQGFGFHEAPRGTLSHWCVIEDGKIKNYQCVVPSTWNAGPRDGEDQMGPYEASLVGNPIADPERPLEVLRTIHSFDPCLACAIHTLDPEGNEVSKVRVR